ncbi:tyrosine-type recombinase/integrase [Enterococcus ratti]|uniref:Site-specific tyrosine recombinase XerC-family n=1 Tax=Enterococcus ratti TaxID=150033 RepID=A0A1L8WSE0_9ENTE|nr:site-specific integrase [Enterococcus ratti]OJG83941.1 site-specific tyrosine recombinase XerC-family [Enterococcus ratti]
MDQKTRKHLQKKLKERSAQLPPIFQVFLNENRTKLSLSSRYEYAKDFHLLTDYLREVSGKEVTDTLILQLEKQDYLNFLENIYKHTRTFQTTTFQSTNQQFKNGYYGLSRKQYSLNHFLRFLYQKELLAEELSLLGKSLPETPDAAWRYMDASLFQHFENLFIPAKGFSSAREASFEKKNRPRNLAIVAVLLYCGLKIHEVVELKRKDIDLTKQVIFLTRKKNRLNQSPIPNEALPFLSSYLETSKEGTTSDSFVFRSSHEQQISPRTIRQILSKITVYKNISPELCRKTYGYYVFCYFGDMDIVNYLYGNRYLNKHSFEEVYKKMLAFSYKN